MMKVPSRKNIRLKDYDYSQNGAYYVTICTHDKKCIFGNIVNSKIYYNGYGKIACSEILNTIEKRKQQGVSIDKYIVMPNHVHMIIAINNVGTWLAMSESQNKFSSPIKNSIAMIIGGYKSAVSRQIRKDADMASHVPTVWQGRYYDHIIRNKHDYGKVWEYIDSNILKWEQDCFYVK